MIHKTQQPRTLLVSSDGFSIHSRLISKSLKATPRDSCDVARVLTVSRGSRSLYDLTDKEVYIALITWKRHFIFQNIPSDLSDLIEHYDIGQWS